LTRRS
jgi:pimeloyl-ACP methyl ester carboxylesterase